MKIDIIGNFIRAHMANGKYVRVLWDEQLMDEDTFIEEARAVITCEPPVDITNCINDVIDQVKFLTAEQVLKSSSDKLENVNDLMELKAQIALESVVCDLDKPEYYGCSSYYELYNGLRNAFLLNFGASEPYWPDNMEVYAELDEHPFEERYYELRYKYEDVSFLFDRLKNRPEAMSWLVNGKGLENDH